MPGDEYFASAGALKLKGVDHSGIRKKKKKKKKDKDWMKDVFTSRAYNQDEVSTSKIQMPRKTDAELKFEQRRRRMDEERISKKANTTHKDKVAKFNKHLDELPEAFDIPKVSWTK